LNKRRQIIMKNTIKNPYRKQLLYFLFIFVLGSTLCCKEDRSKETKDDLIDGSSAKGSIKIMRTGSGTVQSSISGIECGTECFMEAELGTSVVLTASAASGYEFSGWESSECSGTGNCNILVDGHITIGANFSPLLVEGTQHIDLTLRETPVALGMPIKTGIPFPNGAVYSTDNLRLENEDSSVEIPAQFDVLVRWPNNSIKVALVQFVGNMGETKNYKVAYGTGVTRSSLPFDINITQAGGNTTVDTGLIKFSINSKGSLYELWRDTNADSQYQATEQIINGGDIYIKDAFSGTEYTASSADDATITIESSGPLRTVIKAEGFLRKIRQETLNFDGGHKYVIRYYASRESDKIDIEFTLIDYLTEDKNDSTTDLAIALSEIGMRWSYINSGSPSYRFGGESDAVYSGTVSGEHYLLQNGDWTFDGGVDLGYTFTYNGVGSGSIAPGWLSLNSGSNNATLMLKDFWKQYPMELSLDSNTITAKLFSERSISGSPDTQEITQSGTIYRRPNTFYFHKHGGAKTYYLKIAAHQSSPDNETINNLNNNYQRHELDLLASPEWYTSSGVWGDLDVGLTSHNSNGGYDSSWETDPSSSKRWDYLLMTRIYEDSILEPSIPIAVRYGWRDFGDRRRPGYDATENGVRIPSFYNDTHVGASNFFKMFIRTGNMRWFNLGEIATRHTMDIDFSHAPTFNVNRQRMRNKPAGELKASGHNVVDHESTNLHFGHAHISGTSELYLLTGDLRSLDVLKEIGGWWKEVRPNYFVLPFDFDEYFREAERDFAWPLYVMNEYVRVTGDDAYHRDVAAKLVEYLIQWWQTPRAHIGYNPATGYITPNIIAVNDASQGTGYWTMTRMDNNSSDADGQANGTIPWMAGPLIANIIIFYEQDKLFNTEGKGSSIDHGVLIDMLLQAQNYVVKYGLFKEHPPSDDFCFVYSEVRRPATDDYDPEVDDPCNDPVIGDDDDHHILYGLAYLNRLFNRIENGSITGPNPWNPEWYDTQAQWEQVLNTRYGFFKDTATGSSSSLGFYGYEIVYPLDFFKIMRETTGF
jgi:hypothetical protein